MPGREEFQSYMRGVWLLLLQDPAGFRYLDLTDRGTVRSFWAMLYAGPAILLSWLWWRAAYLASMPQGASAGGDFFFRLAMIEALNWIIPLVLVGLVTWALGIGSKFSKVVVAVNWLGVPLSYLYGMLILLSFFFPWLAGIVALLWVAMLLVVITSYFRVLRMVCNGHALTAATLTMVLLIPTIMFSDFLEKFLGVASGG